MTDIKLPPMPKPHTPPVFATAANTQSVKAGYELGGYEKTPPLFDEHQLEAYAREAVRLNAQPAQPLTDEKEALDLLNAENNRLTKLVIELRAEAVRLNAQAQQPLTEKEIDDVMREAIGYGLSPIRDDLELVRAIEQAHGIGVKND